MDNVNDIDKHISLRTLRFSLRLVGMWPVESLREQLLSDILLFNTVALMIMAVMIETFDLYCSWGDLHAVSYNAPNTTTVTIELLELTRFALNRSEVMKFNAYTEKTFWKIPYDAVEQQILNKCNRQSLTMVIIHIFNSQYVAWLCLTIPIVESAGRNISERTLPFDLHLDLPLTQTPYYEIAFLMEAAGMVSVGLCTTGFAGFLCTTNLYAAGQFKILQRRLESACGNNELTPPRIQTTTNHITNSYSWWPVRNSFNWNTVNHTNLAKVINCHSCGVGNCNKPCVAKSCETDFIFITGKDVDENSKSNMSRCTIRNIQSGSNDDCHAVMMKNVEYNILKDCIKQHQLLLDYMERVENLFSAIMLAQALGSILKICFSGFQILLVGGTSILRTMLSIQFLVGSMYLFLMFSWSSHGIIIESQAIAEAIYRASWYSLPYTSEGRACRQSLLIIIARAQKPCILTVGKFAPMSLQTFASVFNTSISYFTILRQMNEQIED